MNRTLVLPLMVLAVVSTTGCSINKRVEPLKAADVSSICVLANPKVLMKGFEPEMQQQLQAMKFRTRTYLGDRPSDCSHYIEYTANWQWDMAMYLTYAEFRVYDARGLAGTATYDARRGGGRLDKFGPTAEKIRPLLNQLFASTSSRDLVPVVRSATIVDAELAAADANRETRLKELARLKDQSLITDEEFSAKRQAILREI